MDFEFDQEFANLFLLALDHGFNSIEEQGGPLIPFTITATIGGEKTLARFAAEFLEEAVEHAQNSINKDRATILRYAVAWDGYITMEETRWDAIFVEAGDRSSPVAYIFCQRYRPVEDPEALGVVYERVGNPALVEQPPSRLSDTVNGTE